MVFSNKKIPTNFFAEIIFSTFGAVYIAAVALFGAMTKDDLQQIPMVGRISVKILSRIGIFK